MCKCITYIDSIVCRCKWTYCIFILKILYRRRPGTTPYDEDRKYSITLENLALKLTRLQSEINWIDQWRLYHKKIISKISTTPFVKVAEYTFKVN